MLNVRRNTTDRPIRVLLFEERPDEAHRIRGMLSGQPSCSFDVQRAGPLEAGLERLGQGDLDAVVLALDVPGQQAIDTFIRVHARAPEVPIVVLGGPDDGKAADELVRDGAQDYLVKGEIQRGELARRIRHAVERGRILTELECHTRRQVSSEVRFRNLIERSADAIVVVNRAGAVRYANPAAEETFGQSAEALQGEQFGLPLTAGEMTEVDIVRKSGEVGVAEMRVVETQWEGEAGYLASLRDITERKLLQAELESTRQEQIEVKHRFLSHVSHELRSPLTAIHQFVTILLDGLAGDLNSDQRQYLEIALRNVEQLRKMIGDLLEVTRFQTGKLTVEPRCISLAEVIGETQSSLQGTAEAKRIGLSANVPTGLPSAYGDPARVKQILANLIENGIKFTPEGGTITVRAEVLDEEPEFIRVAVADTGCGISPEDRERIFEYLHQTGSTLELSRQGLGIGLYLCKELVDRQGGRIWAESEPGQGSTFFFTLPGVSLARILGPILRKERRLAISVALIQVEVSPSDESTPESMLAAALRETRDALLRCVIQARDVLLPRMARGSPGEIFFIVATTDRSGTEVITERIRQELAACEALQAAGINPAVSFTMIDTHPKAVGTSLEQLITDVAARIEDQVNNALAPEEQEPWPARKS